MDIAVTHGMIFGKIKAAYNKELECQLVQRINKARGKMDKILVVYGGKFCYVNTDEPTRTMRTIIEEQSPNVVRIEATHCMDMIASQAEREKIAQELAGGEKVWWMVPGWIYFRLQRCATRGPYTVQNLLEKTKMVWKLILCSKR